MMKTLDITFTSDNNVFTQLRRSERAALYKRETPEGALVSFEVFATLKDTEGNEVYPAKHAFGKWAHSPISLDRAETYFKRIDSNEVELPPFDPHTSEIIRDWASEPSLDEVMAESEDVSTTAIPLVEALVVDEVPSVDSAPVEVVSEVAPASGLVVVNDLDIVDVLTPINPSVDDLSTDVPELVKAPKTPKAVKVKAPKAAVVYNFPPGEWLRDDFAALNGMDHHPAHSDSYGPLMQLVKSGKVKELRKEIRGKGKPRSIYSEVTI